MSTKNLLLHLPVSSLLIIIAASMSFPLATTLTAQPESEKGKSTMTGTWSGTFFSKHSNVSAFSITVVITPNSQGHLTGTSTLDSDCLKGATLELTIDGSNVVLAGSDEEGDSLTLRGNLDSTGTQLKANYVINGSGSGRCETDDGTGSLAKR